MYNEMIKNQTEKNRKEDTSASAPRSASKTELINSTTELMNDVNHETTIYSHKEYDADGKPVASKMNVTKAYRDALKDVAKGLGCDKDDAEKLDTMHFTKKHASAVIDVATVAIKDHLSSGRKFNLPVTSPTEAAMAISIAPAPEKITVGSRFGATEEARNATSVTMERDVLKVKNTVPKHLKYKK